VSETLESSDARLERLREATSGVGPRPDLAARVAAMIERETAAGDWGSDLSCAARRLVPLAALVAAVCLVWAARSERAWDAALIAAVEADAGW
jgi:hypothetical protein